MREERCMKDFYTEKIGTETTLKADTNMGVYY
jgi:hypothetical protein